MSTLFNKRFRIIYAGLASALLAFAGAVPAAKISDVANTAHNLSVTGQGAVRASDEDRICAFCHTPHGATQEPGAPLWNRQLSGQTYVVYTSSSLDAETIQGQLDQPGGTSKLCLSCHDGTLAIGTVNVLGGVQNPNINMIGTAPDDSMPAGSGVLTGFTRDLGVDLRNDHPISLNYSTELADADTELLDPDEEAHIALRAPGGLAPVPLENTGAGGAAQLQCGTCHDPHLRDTDLSRNEKFLRLNRFQEGSPGTGVFNPAQDIVCLGCHRKDGWVTSAHASPTVADELYTTQPAAQRDFPENLPVWQAACLNCHDTHTVSGARRLAREGTDSTTTPKSGGNSAIEETCYQCHSDSPVITNSGNQVKDIKSDFNLQVHMPIATGDQAADSEIHDIVDSDFTEAQATLGKGDLTNRHAECTDCHNPHRLMRNAQFNGSGANQATHDHSGGHTNIASGALRGAWGVEPVYGAGEFTALPTSYVVKQGDGGQGASTAVGSDHLTREYQICLKCHSDFGYNDSGAFPDGGRPNLGNNPGGGTLPDTNGLNQYTNQAMEFQPNDSSGATGAGSNYQNNNHRSWHPVIDDTGRSAGNRNASASAWLTPWNSNVGSQTMYCSDCHGSNTGNTTVEPTGDNPWGPHGSDNEFLLKGTWDDQTGGQSRDVPATDPNNGICFKCHRYQAYADRNGDDTWDSGFSNGSENNLHAVHADRIESMHCMWCHTAVPHGFKNKALLVNLNDVGPEAGQAPGTEIASNSSGDVYNAEPYYFNAKLKVRTFQPSGSWNPGNCGSAGATISGNDTQFGRDWMKDTCSNPP